MAEKILTEGGQYAGFDINQLFQPDYVGDAHHLADIASKRFYWVVLSDILEHIADQIEFYERQLLLEVGY